VTDRHAQREDDVVDVPGRARVSLAGRLAARAVTLTLDAENAPDEVVDHLLRLARGDVDALDRAAGHVEHRHHRPASATAQLAVASLRAAALVATDAHAPPADRASGTLA
jgi:hypothetical protein